MRSCGFVEREGLFALEGDSRTAKMVDFDEENKSSKMKEQKRLKKKKKVANKYVKLKKKNTKTL